MDCLEALQMMEGSPMAAATVRVHRNLAAGNKGQQQQQQHRGIQLRKFDSKVIRRIENDGSILQQQWLLTWLTQQPCAVPTLTSIQSESVFVPRSRPWRKIHFAFSHATEGSSSCGFVEQKERIGCYKAARAL
jgi:hypothetical protein